MISALHGHNGLERSLFFGASLSSTSKPLDYIINDTLDLVAMLVVIVVLALITPIYPRTLRLASLSVILMMVILTTTFFLFKEVLVEVALTDEKFNLVFELNALINCVAPIRFMEFALLASIDVGWDGLFLGIGREP